MSEEHVAYFVLGTLAARRRTGVDIGFLGARRPGRDHLRLRVIASCGPLLGQSFPAHSVMSRLGLHVLGRSCRFRGGKEEVDLAVFERGVQGLLIE